MCFYVQKFDNKYVVNLTITHSPFNNIYPLLFFKQAKYWSIAWWAFPGRARALSPTWWSSRRCQPLTRSVLSECVVISGQTMVSSINWPPWTTNCGERGNTPTDFKPRHIPSDHIYASLSNHSHLFNKTMWLCRSCCALCVVCVARSSFERAASERKKTSPSHRATSACKCAYIYGLFLRLT